MWFRAILNALRSGLRRRSRRSSPGQSWPKLSVEALEDRTVPAFVAPVNHAVGSYPSAVAVGHFNADTTLDLVVTNSSSSSVSVLLGNSNGTFQPAQEYSTGTGPNSLAVGDIDDDGDDDVITSTQDGLSVLLCNGDGTFAPAQTLTAVANPLSVAVGDFNNDGNLDLGVTSNLYHGPYPYYDYYGNLYYSGFYTGEAHVLLGNGSGDFSLQSTTAISSSFTFGSAVGYLDGDSNLDMVTANADLNGVSVLLGNGSGGFSSVTDRYTGSYLVSVTVGDVDGDGHPDIVTPNFDLDNVSVLRGDGNGGFGAVQQYAAGSSPYSVAVGDFNGDHIRDLVTANLYGDNVSVLIGKGDGTFNVPLNSGTGSFPVSVVAGDFNGDGLDDVATANSDSSGTVSILLNAGNFPAANGPSITIGDVTLLEGNVETKLASFTVSLSAAPTQTITVNYSTANGTATTADSDYVLKSGTVTFNPGGPLTQTIDVTVNGDRRAEQNETFFVNLSGAPNAYITDAQGVATITDDEPRLTISNASVTEGNRGTKVITFTVTLSIAYDIPVTVDFATSDGSAKVSDNDYVAKSGTLTFNPGGPLTQTISITIIGDQKKEPTESFYVNLSNANNALILDALGVGTIFDNDNGNGSGKKSH